MLGRTGGTAPFQIEPLQEEIPQAPTGAVTGQTERQVVDMEIAVVVGLPDFLRIFFQGVLGLHRSGQMEHEPLEGMPHIGVLVYPPIGFVQIVVYGVGNIQIGLFLAAKFPPFLPVQDVFLGHVKEPGLHKDHLHHVLDLLLFRDVKPGQLTLDLFGHPGGEQGVLNAAGIQGL